MDKLKSQFEVRKPEYLESYKPFSNSTSLNYIAKSIKEYIAKTGNRSLSSLDMMAGSGIVGRKMQEQFPELKVVYQDKSPVMLSSGTYHDDQKRILSDSVELGTLDESFDVVFCRAGLNNVPKADYPKILGESIRVLRQGGVGILQDHFPDTEEAQEVINSIETEIKRMESIGDETYVPTTEELRGLVQAAGGEISNKEFFEARFSVNERFVSKGILQPDLSSIRQILEKQNAIKYEIINDDIFLIYPIVTITFTKTPLAQ